MNNALSSLSSVLSVVNIPHQDGRRESPRLEVLATL